MTEHSKERDDNLTRETLESIYQERLAQHKKWGRQRLPSTLKPIDIQGARPVEVAVLHGVMAEAEAKWHCDNAAKHGECTFAHILVEEVAEVLNAETPHKRECELVQLAAVCVQWLEEIARQRAERMEDGE